MAYTKQTWSDGKAGATPINAARLQNIENGLALAGQFLGSGTAFPATGIGPGDWFLRTDIGAAPGTMYQYNGVTWNVGVSDSGWINFTPLSPVVAGSTGCKYRNVNGVVHVHLDSNYNGAYSGNFVFATLPVGYRPGVNVYGMGQAYSAAANSSVPVAVYTNGSVALDFGGSVTFAGIVADFVYLAA